MDSKPSRVPEEASRPMRTISASIYTVESETFTLNPPVRKGYAFLGWTGTDLSEPALSVTIPQGSMGERSYRANWELQQYEIILHLDGGSAENPSSYTVETPTFILSNPTKFGYTFGGWMERGMGSAMMQVTVEKGSVGALHYVAVWIPDVYPITYDLAGGMAEANPGSYTIETPSFTLNNPTKDGYVFAGWVGTGCDEPAQLVSIPRGSAGARSYTATWVTEGYTIAYDLSGGRASGNPAVYTTESEDIVLNAPVRPGYTFLGWTGTGLTGTVKEVTIPSGSVGNRNYTAEWKREEYTITYHIPGVYTHSNPVRYHVESERIELVNPTRDGFVFLGWTGTDLTEPTLTVVIPKGSTGHRVYTASWALCEYTIRYDLSGGSVEDNPDRYTVQSETFRLNQPTRAGYVFTGWTGEDLYSPSLRVEIEKGSTGDRAYTATWTCQVYTITYNLAGGMAENPDSYTVESEALTLNPPVRKGYTFLGWTGTDLTEACQMVTIPGGSLGNRSYTAHWALTEYEIRYDLAGGAAEGNPTHYTIETPTFRLNAPIRVGYTFVGWIGEDLYSASLRVEIEQGSVGARVYTAVWKENEYAITYDLAGGWAENPTSYTVQTPSIVLSNPVREGYTFLGWTGTGLSERTLQVMIEQGSISDRSYTAHWAPTEYRITYDLAGGMAENPDRYTVETDDFELTKPVRTGYIFTGWIGEDLYSPSLRVEILQGSLGDRSYTATWKAAEYQILYRLEGGSVEGNPDSYTIESDDIVLVNPTRLGYEFGGWTGTGLTEPSMKVVIPMGSTGVRVYTAVWVAEGYRISYDLRGGTVEGNPISYNTETETFTLVNPTRAGYFFTGWIGTGLTRPTLTVTIPQGSSGDRHYIAMWTAKVYTIEYDLAGGTVSGNPDTYTVETKTFTLNNPTRTGYTFAGWVGTDLAEPTLTVTIPKGSLGDRSYTATWDIGENTPYRVEHYLQNLEDDDFTLQETEHLAGETESEVMPAVKAYPGFASPELQQGVIKTDGSLVVRYHYYRNRYAVAYRYEGDVPDKAPEAPETQHVKFAQSVSVAPAPELEGYTFSGWNSEDTSVRDGSFTMPAQDVSFVGSWRAHQYTVYFHPNGGSGQMEQQSFLYDAEQELRENAFRREGYTFQGWTMTYNGEVVYENCQTVKNLSSKDGAAVTLYAVWEESPEPEIPEEPVKPIEPVQPDSGGSVIAHECTLRCVICGGCMDKTCLLPARCRGHRDLFSDVPPDAWYAEAVEYVCCRGLMRGVGNGKFDPMGVTTRAMLTSILWRLEGEAESKQSHLFRDVGEGEWYAKAVAWAAEQEIVFGISVDTFSPHGELSREQLVSLLWRYVRYRGGNTATSGRLDAFHDADAVSDYAVEAMRWAYGMGLVSGKGNGVLDPDGEAKRCELASILMRFLKAYNY